MNLRFSLIALGIFVSIGTFCQEVFNPIKDFSIARKHVGDKALEEKKSGNSIPIDNEDSMYVSCAFEVVDWSNLASFHLKLSIPGKGVFRDVIIPISNPNDNLPEGMRYWVVRRKVYITLGKFTDMERYKAQLLAKDINGDTSEPLLDSNTSLVVKNTIIKEAKPQQTSKTKVLQQIHGPK